MTALIILTYNNVECLRRCLESARKLDAGRVVPIIVDNASEPANLAAAIEAVGQAWGVEPQVLSASNAGAGGIGAHPVVVASTENLGYARGNNLGMKVAEAMGEAEYVLLANDDIVFTSDIVPGLRRVLAEEQSCGIAAPVLYRPGMKAIDHNCARRKEKVGDMIAENVLGYWWKWRGYRHAPRQMARYILASAARNEWPDRVGVDLPSGACMMASLDLMRRIGGLDSRTFLYYEENILMAKLSREGLRCVVDTRLGAVHLGAATTSKAAVSYDLAKESCRSQIYYVKEYSGAGLLVRFLHRLSAAFFLASCRLQHAVAPGYIRRKMRRAK